MGKKATLKKIRRLANALPEVETQTVEKHLVLGAVLIEQGDTERDGEPIEPQKIYEQYMPVVIARNHKRRMYKAYRQHGAKGVQQYQDSVKKLGELN